MKHFFSLVSITESFQPRDQNEVPQSLGRQWHPDHALPFSSLPARCQTDVALLAANSRDQQTKSLADL